MTTAAENEIEGLDAIAGDLDMIGQLHFAQRMEGHVEIVGVVLDEQDFDFGSFAHDWLSPFRVK
jgi:hypothetical protein